MAKRWIVFSGWAVDPGVLAPLFPSTAIVINSCSVIPGLLAGNVLRADWKERLVEQSGLPFPLTTYGVAGWSTGAMLAYALARAVHPAVCVLLSATPSFRRTKDFPFGHKLSVMRAMREGLQHSPDKVINAFYAKCGLSREGARPSTTSLRSNELTAGLHFLEQAVLFPVEQLTCPTLVLHGREDAIVPFQAGRFFSEKINGSFASFQGPHAFFNARYEEVRQTIERFAEKAA